MKLMKRYRTDKPTWELFIFSVCLKMAYGSSAVHPSVPVVRKLMNCSYYKAERMIERAKRENYLFRYYPEANLLIARSFTHGRLQKNEYRYGAKTVTAYSAFCHKFRFDRDGQISHMEVSRRLRDALLVHAMKARQLKNDLSTVVSANKTSTRSNRSTALYSVKLARIAGCHHTTVSRHIAKMEKTGDVSVYRPAYTPVAYRRTGVMLTDDRRLTERRRFPKGDYEVVRDANEYFVSDKNSDVFVNVIFNHRERHRRNTSACDKRIYADRWLEFINR